MKWDDSGENAMEGCDHAQNPMQDVIEAHRNAKHLHRVCFIHDNYKLTF